MNELIFAGQELALTFLEAAQTLLPIIAFFAAFQLLYLKFPREFVLRVIVGLLMCLLGLTLFLFGVN